MTSEKFNARTPRAPLFCGLRGPYRGLLPAGGALIVVIIAAMLAASVARAQGPTPIISKIEIVGNQRVEEDAIRIHITQQVGQPLDPNAVDCRHQVDLPAGLFLGCERARRAAGRAERAGLLREGAPADYRRQALRDEGDPLERRQDSRGDEGASGGDPRSDRGQGDDQQHHRGLRGQGLHRRQGNLQADPAARQHGVRRIRRGRRAEGRDHEDRVRRQPRVFVFGAAEQHGDATLQQVAELASPDGARSTRRNCRRTSIG